MHIIVTGTNMDVGSSLTEYCKDALQKTVDKYFDTAVKAEVFFSSAGIMFESIIVVNEGVSGGIVVKSNAKTGDAYSCFNEALAKITTQLKKYKSRIKNYRRKQGGIKSEINTAPEESAKGTKYVLEPFADDSLTDDQIEELLNADNEKSAKVINEKVAEIEELTVSDAIMKMDLSNLPALVFINTDNMRLNVVYYRKDGNISWIDPKI